MARIADKLGQPFMPWQRFVADVGGEIDPDTGRPAYREIVVTVPRQSGKTTLFLSWQIHRCVSTRWNLPQRSVFTAQTGKDARDKWLDELYPLIRQSGLFPLVKNMNRGMGNEAIFWKTGSVIRLLSTSASSGHSKTLDQAVMDEIWHDVDDRREQGLRPAMVTRDDAQLLVCSTAGTQASTVYNRKVQTGRQAVQADTGSGIAYFEWSAPDDWDMEDESSYSEFMPALGHTISLSSIRTEREAMEAAEFRRAYGNKPTAAVDRIIPPSVWERVCDPQAKPAADGMRFGMDIAQDRASAAIAAYSNGVIELVEHRPGTGWVAQRCNELTEKWGGTVALDFGGPAGVLADQIDRAERLKGREVIQACAAMYDAIVEAQVTFRTNPAMTDAVEGAVKKSVSDTWVWSRKGSISDVTPLMAATLAFNNPDDDGPSVYEDRGLVSL